MRFFILQRAVRVLFPALIILSLIVLYRGHNLPGGGFIGGLLAATAFILVGTGASMREAQRLLRIRPTALMGAGLATAIGSALPSLLVGETFMTGQWLPDFYLPFLGKIHLGTPLLFDVGVYLVVIGFVLQTTFSLVELGHVEEEEESS